MRPLLRIGKHVVGVVDLLKLRLGVLLFRLARAGVHVGVVFLGEFAVCRFQLVRARLLIHSQYLVIIFICHIFPSATMRSVRSLAVHGGLPPCRAETRHRVSRSVASPRAALSVRCRGRKLRRRAQDAPCRRLSVSLPSLLREESYCLRRSLRRRLPRRPAPRRDRTPPASPLPQRLRDSPDRTW